MEGANELIQRFFQIRNTYVKMAIPLFIIAALINSGLLLFIPGLHILQYPTLALLFTMLAHITGLSIGVFAAKYVNKEIKPDGSTVVLVLSFSFITSIFYICYIIVLYNPVIPLVTFFMICLRTLAITTAAFIAAACIRYKICTK